MTTHVGFTGTRKAVAIDQRRIALLRNVLVLQKMDGNVVLHHGDCIGADAIAHDVARSIGARIVVHPPILASKRAFKSGDEERSPATYRKRNHAIVNETEFLIAMPQNPGREVVRSGTWATVRYARDTAGKRVVLI